MKKRIATIIFTVISFVIISSYSVYAENVVFINDNFENLSTSNWIDNTGRGTKTVEQNEDGKYMVLNSTSSYFNYQANNIYSTRRLYCSADIKFDSGDSEIQVRESRDVSASGFTMAGRLRKRLGYLEYFTNGKYEKMNDSNGNWIKLSDVSKWYTIRMVLDIKTNKYSIYVIDRQAQSVLTKVENVVNCGNVFLNSTKATAKIGSSTSYLGTIVGMKGNAPLNNSLEISKDTWKEYSESQLINVLGDMYTKDVQDKDGKYLNDGYPILKWQLQENQVTE